MNERSIALARLLAAAALLPALGFAQGYPARPV